MISVMFLFLIPQWVYYSVYMQERNKKITLTHIYTHEQCEYMLIVRAIQISGLIE